MSRRSNNSTTESSRTNTRSRFGLYARVLVVIAALAAGTAFTFAASAASPFAFLDSVSGFLGMASETSSVSTSSANSANAKFASLRKEESMFASLLEPMAPFEITAVPTVTGGCTASTVGADTLITCLGAGTFDPNGPISNVQILAVGGGGGGGGNSNSAINDGGGGGGGGYSYGSTYSMTDTVFTVTVGSAGTAGTSSVAGGSGGNSVVSGASFTTITAAGGGGGGTGATGVVNGATGGSGGGGGRIQTGSVNGTGGTGSQGNAGASGDTGRGGGGGGSGAAASSQNGGSGTSNSITGSAIIFSCGGGAGAYTGIGGAGSAGTAGCAGAGAGTAASGNGNAASAPNRGLGGGGGAGNSSNQAGGAGGSGVVYIRYDSTAPTVTNVTSSLANGTYTTGQVVPVQVTFSEAVTVTGTPQLTLSTGTPATTAVNYSSGSGSATLTFNYTVAAGNTSADLNYDATTSLALNGGNIADGGGNAATLTLPGLAAAGSLATNKAIVIDAAAPTVTNVTSSLADGTYTTGQVVPVQVTFSEAVNVTGTPQLTLSTGTPATTVVNYSSGSGSATLVFNYTVAAGNSSADLNYAATNSLALNSGTIRDAALNNATLTLPGLAAAGSLATNKAIVIDTAAPTVTNVTSILADGTYTTGQVVPIQVTFSEAVNVTGTPQLTLSTGTPATTVVNYTGGTGTATLTFTYTVAAGNSSADLNYAATNSLALNGGTIRDAALNNATLTLPGLAAAGSLATNKAIVIDTAAPTVTNVTSSLANGTYTTGQVVPIQVTFSEAVTVTGTPQLTLSTGTPATTAVNYSSGSPGTTLTFNYAVAAGNSSADLNYAATNSLALNGGTIADGGGNAATLTLPGLAAAGSLGTNKNIVIDTAVPTVTFDLVAGSDSGVTNDNLTNATSPVINAIFTEAVSVFANDDLTNIGTATGCTFSVGGPSGNTYPVTVSGCSEGTLIPEIAAGSVTDAGGNPIAQTSGLTVTIDRTVPTVTFDLQAGSDTGSSDSDNITNAASLVFDALFSEAITAGSLTFGDMSEPGNATGCAFVIGTPTGNTYPITVNTCSEANAMMIRIAASAVTDIAGNNIAVTDGPSINIDRTAPTMTFDLQAASDTGSSAVDNITNATSPVFDAIFNEAVAGFTDTDLSEIASVTGCSFLVGSPTGNTYPVTVSGCSEGTLTLRLAGSSVTDIAGNNIAQTDGPAVTIDRTAPTINIGAPSVASTAVGPVDYIVTYTGADAVTLATGDVTLNSTGDAAGTKGVSGALLTSRTVTISSITGDGTLGISIASGTASDTAGNLAAGAGPSATFDVVSAAPEIEVTGGDPTPVPIADEDVTPDVLDGTEFGSVAVSAPGVVHTFTITNSGTADLTVGTITLTDESLRPEEQVERQEGVLEPFTVTQPTSLPIPAGESRTFTVTFDPVVVGDYTYEVSIPNNDSDEGPEYTFYVHGIGIADQEINVTGTFDLGPVAVLGAASATQTMTIQNLGDADLTFSTPTITTGANPGDFTVSNVGSSPIAGGGTATFDVTFNPSAAGARSATVSIVNNDADENPYTFTVSGTGTLTSQGALTINGPASVTYGDTPVVTFSANGSGTGNITYSDGGSTGCDVGASSGIITVTNAQSNDCTITATKDADADYDVQTSNAFVVQLLKATQTATVSNPVVTFDLNEKTAIVACSGGAPGTDVEYDLDGAPVEWTSDKPILPGVYNIRADCAENSNYDPGTNVSAGTFTIEACAAEPPVLSAPDLIKAQGENVTIPVSITETEDKGVVSVNFKLTYDPAILEPIFATPDDPQTDRTVAATLGPDVTLPAPMVHVSQPEAQAGVIYASIYSNEGNPMSGAGVLVNIQMKVKANAPIGQTSPLNLSEVLLTGGLVCTEDPGNGSVAVGGTVTYFGNGSDGGSAPVDASSPYAVGSTVTVLSQGSLTKTNYAFTGWNTQADGGGTAYLPPTTFVMPAANVELYAQWELVAPKITVTKVVVNTGGGTLDVVDFPLFLDGDSVTSGVQVTTTTGAHTISETGDPNYTAVISGDCAADGSITLTLGQTANCTITNTFNAPKITVTKVVVNTGGGTLDVVDFPLFLDGDSVTSGVQVTSTTGAHTVSETGNANYTAVISGDCAADGTITLSAGQTASCTITNTFNAPKITVTKVVVNTGGGTLDVVDFPLFLDGDSVTSGVQVTSTTGAHTVSETGNANYTAVISGDCAADGTITLSAGQTASCTITNTFNAPKITVTKVVVNTGGGTLDVENFPLFLDGDSVTSGVQVTSTTGAHTVSETGNANYTAVISGDCAADGTITLSAGQTASCTITNTFNAPKITVTKVVVNTGGGTLDVENFPLFLDGDSVTSGVQVTSTTGAHTVSETGDANYTAVISGDCAADGTITLSAGQTASCTITNTFNAPKITVTKVVVNTGGGTLDVENFPLFLDGDSVTSGVQVTSTTGAHTVSETGNANYTAVISGDCAADGTITLSAGQTASCTITNTFNAPKITVTKVVVNTGGGTLDVENFPLFLDGDSVTSGVQVTSTTGAHTVSETGNANYTAVISGDCAADGTITLSAGQTASCTITNTFNAPKITVTKVVVNTGGGTLDVENFPLFLDGDSVTSGVQVTSTTGAHTVSETGDANYTAVISGDCAADGTITLSAGQTASCTITNTFRAITGNVRYSIVDKPVPGVLMTAAGSPTVSDTTDLMTDPVPGSYSLSGFGAGSYTVTPSRAKQLCGTGNGIFADDAAKVSQHVVHLITLEGDALLAAKVSGTSTPALSSFDAALIAQKSVASCSGINIAGEWRFTPSNKTYASVTTHLDENYTAYMMGDVNGDWSNSADPNRPEQTDSPDALQALVPNMAAAPGTTAVVPFRLANLGGTGVTSYQFDIEYDPAVIEPAQIAADLTETLSTGLNVVWNAPVPGLLKVAVYGAYPVTGDGVFVNLRFSAIGGAGTSSPLRIRGFRLNDGTMQAVTTDGQLSVASSSGATIRGRIITSAGLGIRNARILLTNSAGVQVIMLSSSFGQFEFPGLLVGETYIVTVQSKRFRFAPQIIGATDSVTNLEMIALD